MSQRTDDNIRLNFIINGDPARQELNKLDKETNKLKNQMKGLRKGSDEYIAAQKQLSTVRVEQERLRKQIGLTAMSMRDLTSEARRLRSIKNYLTPGTEEFKKTDRELQKVNARLKELRTGTRQAGLSLSSMADGFNRYVGVVAGITATFAGVILGARKAVEEFNNFEQKMANLSALTGLVGEDLNYLGREAADMATSVVEGNIRITQSAESIVDAFTKVGSQRPELLKNKEALAAVTQDALILAEAGNMELAPAVSAVTTALNQMNLQAGDSRRVINAIAAGSKVGAADVPYLTAALEKTGTTASLMGQSIEQVVGAIETVAPFYSRAEMAGNSLDKVMLRMRANNIGYVNGVFSMEAALKELEHRFATGESSVDIFGVEHAKMAEVLVANQQQFVNYTAAVTDTNIALEQAAINTDTNLAKLEQARNRYKENLRDLGGLLAPIMTFSTNFFSYLMKTVLSITKNYDLYRDILVALIATYIAYNAQAIIATATTIKANVALAAQNTITRLNILLNKTGTIATQLFAAAKFRLAGNTLAANNAMKLLKATMATTPWGAVMAGVAAVSAALLILWRNYNRTSELQKSQNAINKEINQEYDQQAAKIATLSRTIENANAPLRKRQEAIEDLKRILPEYNGYISEEGKLIGHNKTQLDNYLTSLKKEIELKAVSNEMENLIIRQSEVRREMERSQQAFLDYAEKGGVVVKFLKESVSAATNGAIPGMRSLALDVNKTTTEFNEVTEALAATEKQFDSLTTATITSTTATTDNSDATTNNNETLEKAIEIHDILKLKISDTEKNLNLLTIALRNATLNAMQTGDFTLVEKLQQDIAALKTQLDNLKADDIILSGVANTGSIDSFLASLTDSEDTFFADQEERNRQFLENWGNARVESETEVNRRLLDEQLDANSKAQEERIESEKEVDDLIKKNNQNRNAAILQTAETLTRSVADLWHMYNQKNTDDLLNELNQRREKELSNQNLTEAQKEKINEKYRQEEAKIKKDQFIKQKRASVIESLINTALAITKALPNIALSILAGIAGGAQTAVIAAQPVPQFAKGRYQVKGADDGRTYTAPFIGSPQTGIYNKPALFAETGSEIIIDPRTTRNIITNYPEIMSAINAVRVRQYATGSYPDQSAASNSFSLPGNTESQVSEIIPLLITAIDQLQRQNQRLNDVLNRGIQAKLSLFDIDKLSDDRDAAENETSY